MKKLLLFFLLLISIPIFITNFFYEYASKKYVAGIIVKTKDVKFDEDISLADANLSVRKLMQYSKTVDNVTEFLNNQINKIYKGYIDKSKNENITDIKRKCPRESKPYNCRKQCSWKLIPHT